MIYTRNSKIKTGKHSGKTVEEVLKKKNGIGYLRFVYFNSKHFDFTPEILGELNIPMDQRISKTTAFVQDVPKQWTKSWLRSVNHGHNKYSRW